MIEKAVMLLMTMFLDYILDPDNLKSLFKKAMEYVDGKAQDGEENFWDTLDNFMDLIAEMLEERKSDKLGGDGECE